MVRGGDDFRVDIKADITCECRAQQAESADETYECSVCTKSSPLEITT